MKWFQQRLKVYPLSTGPREARYTNATGVGINPLPAEDGSVFEMLNEIIQHEPKELFGAEQLGRLATLGIVKGKPFNPDARMRRILDQGARQGAAMSRATTSTPPGGGNSLGLSDAQSPQAVMYPSSTTETLVGTWSRIAANLAKLSRSNPALMFS